MDTNFAENILQWYHLNKRDLPWRETSDPYKIWISEIILQQTRIDQGLPYYFKFIEQFPSIRSLSMASEEEVLRAWQGLGYYSRARNLLACAKVIQKDFNGKIPPDYRSLLSLPGIGPYTAAAISSFAFGLPEAVLDGNVMRVLSRAFGVEDDITTGRGQRVLRDLAYQLLPENHSQDYNQGIMEFGAMQCVPGPPDCSICPIHSSCFARINGKQRNLPVKLKKTVSKVLYFNYFVLEQNNKYWMFQRGKGIWDGLYEFHLVEEQLNEPEEYLKKSFDLPFQVKDISFKKHLLSHREIHSTFIWVQFDSRAPELPLHSEKSRMYSLEDIENLPKPILIEWYLKEIMEV